MRTPSPDEIAEALRGYERLKIPALPGRRNHLRAGVLLPLVWKPDPIALATLRPPDLPLHGGEVCFPGGKPEAEDDDLWATARREAREELGIRAPRLLGRLSAVPLYTSEYRLVPFVAEVGDDPLSPSAAEVARIIRLPLLELLAAPQIDAIPWTWEGRELLSPVFARDGTVMYGGTAHCFYELLAVLAPLCDAALPPLVAGRYTWEGVWVR